MEGKIWIIYTVNLFKLKLHEDSLSSYKYMGNTGEYYISKTLLELSFNWRWIISNGEN